MNRKNLTAAVLAGLAGAAGIAGTAQAVNLNPDGLGQVLIYPYYTTNDGNATLLSVVNTTDQAKAVKVRFNEGYNSREVLDFNLYMSAYDVWTAAIIDGGTVAASQAGVPHLLINDSSCTVPYLYGDGGLQAFLNYAYTGKNTDGGPTGISRASEGHFEMIEMGTLTNDTETKKRLGSASAATHVIDSDGVQAPADCEQLVDNWTDNPEGMWLDDNSLDIDRNSGGLFGGAAIINVANGTMFAYDAQAIQGFDKSDDAHLHAEPGDLDPNLDSGDQLTATIFFGVPKDEAVALGYTRGVDAVSATLMHEFTMNEYLIEPDLNAGSEWIVTFPTKNYYVDRPLLKETSKWQPDTLDNGCGDWDDDEIFPARSGPYWEDSVNKVDKNPENGIYDVQEDWVLCTYVEIDTTRGYNPFTTVFDGDACEEFGIIIWDREENSFENADDPIPPVVSPRPPGGGSTPGVDEMCYEVNVLRFGNDDEFVSVFGTTSALLYTVDTGAVSYDAGSESKPRLAGWAQINWGVDSDHVDDNGLLGLPVTGFWASQFENGYAFGPGVLSNYGGLFSHKGNVRRISAPRR